MNYGLLRVERSGSVSRVLIVDVADDRTALARAKDFAGDWTVEVWCSGSRIASLATATGRTAAMELRR